MKRIQIELKKEITGIKVSRDYFGNQYEHFVIEFADAVTFLEGDGLVVEASPHFNSPGLFFRVYKLQKSITGNPSA